MIQTTLPPVSETVDLGLLNEKPDWTGGGQSIGVWKLPRHPGLLFKRYNPESARHTSPRHLDRLIAQPGKLTGQNDRDLVATRTAWPVSRVTRGGATVGVVIKAAPVTMDVEWLAARGSTWRTGPIEVDLLAKGNEFLAKRKIPEQSAEARTKLCIELMRLASFLERCGIVYADWSYANAFWHPIHRTIFLIDLDGCSYGPRPHVFTPNFEEPEKFPSPPGAEKPPVDTCTDRYRAALLCARILTGRRELADVRADLKRMAGEPPRLLLLAIDPNTDRGRRPRLTDIRDAFVPPIRAGSGSRPTTMPPPVPVVPRQTGTGSATGTVPASGVAGWRSRKDRNGPVTGNGPPLTTLFAPATTPYARTTTTLDDVEQPKGITFGGVITTLAIIAAFVAFCMYVL